MESLTNKEVVSFFKELDYRKQRLLLTELRMELKPAPYFIRFDLAKKEQVTKMAKVAGYCTKNKIPFQSEKVKGTIIRFKFEDLEKRNETIIGAMCNYG